jgi:hypothetical protein
MSSVIKQIEKIQEDIHKQVVKNKNNKPFFPFANAKPISKEEVDRTHEWLKKNDPKGMD